MGKQMTKGMIAKWERHPKSREQPPAIGDTVLLLYCRLCKKSYYSSNINLHLITYEIPEMIHQHNCLLHIEREPATISRSDSPRAERGQADATQRSQRKARAGDVGKAH